MALLLPAATDLLNNPDHAFLHRVLAIDSAAVEQTLAVTAVGLGIGTTTPTAVLHLKAGTTAASTAPLKFTSGSLLTTAEAGAVEFLTDKFYGTITTGAARKTFAFLESPVFTGTVTIPTPFTLGATSVTTTGTQLNYLNAATGTTGTTTTNLVFSTSPTLITPALGTPSALVLTNATGLPAASVLAGTFGTGAYTMDTTLTVPKVIGGTATTSDLSLQTTSGIGATGADMHFLVGNNGATEAMTILNGGNVGIGTTTPAAHLQIDGNISAAAWTTDGIAFDSNAATYTDTSTAAAGTVAVRTANSFGAPTFASTNAITVTDAFTLYVPKPIAGTNTTITRANSAYFEGNVGIGTTAPSEKLVIQDASGIVNVLLSPSGYGAYKIRDAGWGMELTSDLNYLRIAAIGPDGTDTTRGVVIGRYNTAGSTWYPTAMFRSDGNVGIGTTTPISKLDVNGLITSTGTAGGFQITRRDTSAGTWVLYGPSGTTDLRFNGASGDMVTIQTSGNVGIGTTAPKSKLDIVSGSAAPASSGDMNTGVIISPGYGGSGLNLGTLSANYSWIQSAYTDAANVVMPLVLQQNGGNVGIGTITPTNILSLGGNSARSFWMERHTTANTAGNTLTITAGGATAAATDKAGGDLILQPGVSTGSAESGVQIKGCVAGISGTADRTQTIAIQVLGNKIGFYAATPVALQTGVAVTAAGVHAALVNLGLITA